MAHGLERLERQRRATRVRTWTDGEGMVCLTGRFGPVTGRRIGANLDVATQALFAEATPDTCPIDPVEKQQHLQGLALAELVAGAAPAAPSVPRVRRRDRSFRVGLEAAHRS